jgi:ShK domain-like
MLSIILLLFCTGGVHGSRFSYKNVVKGAHADTVYIYDNDDSASVAAGPCVDLREKCAEYADAGGCKEDPRWMHPHCPISCGVCDRRVQDVPRSQSFGHRNRIYSGEVHDAIRDDILGVPQRLVPGHETAVRERIEHVVDYMNRVVMEEDRYTAVREICRTVEPDCAFWAITDECTENEEYMIEHCAPVCFACEKLHVDAKCPIDPNEKHGT